MNASSVQNAAEHAVAADRFAREILACLMTFCAARSRRLNGNPLGGQASERGV
jgi:hypothetical protein